MAFFSFNEKSVYYQIKESKTQNLVLFVHGSGGNSNIWKNQMNLNLNYDIIAVDLPSHGKSDFFPSPSLELYVDVIKKLIDSFHYEKIILCGHSLGGAIIQSFYYQYPTEVNVLILVGTGARLRVSESILNSIKDDYNYFLNTILRGAFHRKTSKEIIESNIRETSLVKSEITYRDFKICDNFNTIGKTHSIKVPCLIICGDADNLTPVKYSKFFHEKIKKSKLVIIKQAGHMVMLEKPIKVNKEFENFISQQLN